MRKIGYARVSTSTQNLDRQIGALRAERCDEVYREKASGKAIKGRPQLEKAIDALGTSEVLVVAEWDRATRSMMDGVHIIERIHSATVVKPGDPRFAELDAKYVSGCNDVVSSAIPKK
jgi:DNA invertase Pin-like site-specific DNA recombinase